MDCQAATRSATHALLLLSLHVTAPLLLPLQIKKLQRVLEAEL